MWGKEFIRNDLAVRATPQPDLSTMNPCATFGEVIVEARHKAKLTQRQLAALIKNEEGHGISAPYLNDIEHGFRHPPRGFLLQQFATVLNVDVDLLYFLARQLPVELDFNKVSEQQGVTTYRTFRQILTGKTR